MRKLTGAFVVVGVFLWGIGHAQMLSEKPNPVGGNPVGIWEAKDIPLQVYAAPELLAIVSELTFSGTVSGGLTLDNDQGFVADYIVVANVKVSLGFLGQIDTSFADTVRSRGTYAVEGTDLILISDTTPAVRDTLGFSATADSLVLVQGVPLGAFADLVKALAPTSDPPAGVLRMGKVGDPGGGSVTLTADFNQDNIVDFQDFLVFAAHFGKRVGEAGYDAAFDLNGSGTVDFPDFLDFASQFGLSK